MPRSTRTRSRRPHTIAPDALARNPKPLKLETVDEEREFKDGAMTVELFHIAGNPHADTLLMAYFPKERILVEADAFSPGSAVQPYAANLLENITKRKLKVDRIVPLHGTIAPFSALVSATKQRLRRNRGDRIGRGFIFVRRSRARARPRTSGASWPSA